MIELASCPTCQALVRLPSAARPETRVRCPLCDDEYALADALARAPPELIVVDAAWVAVRAPGRPVAGAEELLAIAAWEGEGGALGDDGLVWPAESGDGRATDAADADGEAVCEAEPARYAPSDSDVLTEAEAIGAARGSRSWRFAEPAHAAANVDPAAVAIRARSGRRAAPGAVVTLVGWVLGAVMGLAIGYVILLTVFGKDPLKLFPSD